MSQVADSAIPEVLLENLRALAVRDQPLVERLLLPVAGDHVRIDPDGTGHYREHREFVPFTVPESEVARILVEPGQGDVLLFGVGLGELLEPLLAEESERQIVAWDRDPWLLRQTLIARDFTEAIRSGRVTFKLGADLLDLLESPQQFEVLAHPFLSRVYRWEHHCLEHGIGDRRAALAPGTLVADDLAQALRELGYTIFPLERHRWSEEELRHAVERIDPGFVACINYSSGLSEFCRSMGRQLLLWEIDPTTDRRIECSGATDHAHVFTYRRGNRSSYWAAGFEHAEYLPLAADTKRRRPLTLSAEEEQRLAAPISFVGSSLVATASEHHERLCALYADWHPDGLAALPDFRADLVELLDRQRAELPNWTLPELMQQRFGDFLSAVAACGQAADPVALLGETAASERRLEWMASLADLHPNSVHVWGDAHWKSLETRGVLYRGTAGHQDELTRIYNASAINIDLGRLYQTDIVTLRVFDVLACGGFLIAERSEALEELFEVGVELEAYSTLEELHELVAHYLAHPEEAQAMALRGLRAVRERHDVRSRLRHMLSSLELATTPA